MQKITLENRLLMIDTNTVSFDMQEIENRRFMYSPDSCELIIGEQYKGNDLIASHAEEHGKAGAKAPLLRNGGHKSLAYPCFLRTFQLMAGIHT